MEVIHANEKGRTVCKLKDVEGGQVVRVTAGFDGFEDAYLLVGRQTGEGPDANSMLCMDIGTGAVRWASDWKDVEVVAGNYVVER